MTATNALALQVEDTRALDAWESLAERIALASQQDESKVFHYEVAVDAKAARSWISELRRIRGGIERARKDAKAIHLERGRAVDSTAKALTEAVDGLISRHALPLEEITAREQARVDCHRHTLDRIAALSQGVTTSAEAAARLTELRTIDPAILEEFTAAGAARWAEAETSLLEQRDRLLQVEADQRELEQLRAAEAARQAAEREERIRREARQQAEAEAEQRRADEAARQERERIEAAAREQRAREQAEWAEQARQQAEAEARRLREQQEADQARRRAEWLQQQQAAAEQQARERQAKLERSAELNARLFERMAGMGRNEIAAAIVDGTLHPAVVINWELV